MDTCGLSMWNKIKIEISAFLKETATLSIALFVAVLLILIMNFIYVPQAKNNPHDIADQIAYTYDSIKIGKISKDAGYVKIDSLTMELKNDIKNNSRK